MDTYDRLIWNWIGNKKQFQDFGRWLRAFSDHENLSFYLADHVAKKPVLQELKKTERRKYCRMKIEEYY